MVEIYSPSGEENRLAEFLIGEMSKLGFRVNLDAVGNVIGKVGDGRPRVLLCGHMDTIPSLLPVNVVGDVLYGRGAVDAKAALATMIIAASQLVKEDYAGEILVVGAVDEEGKGRGVKHLVDEELDVDYAIFGEPTNVETVTIGYKGSLLLKIVCETETGHSSAPWLFENAVEKAIEIWFTIKGLKMPGERPESRFHSLSFCLRRIEGGGEGSVVPPRCEVYIEIRIPPSITVEQIRKRISEIIKKYSEENPKVKVELEVMDYTEPFMADKRSTLVKAFSRAIWRVRGKQPRLIYKTGTGDMNVFGNSTGKTTVTYGPGNSHLDHTPNEHVSLNDYLESINVLKEALKNLNQLHQAQV
jgi:LysW-gamma-L-lysine carboxypeptidase